MYLRRASLFLFFRSFSHGPSRSRGAFPLLTATLFDPPLSLSSFFFFYALLLRPFLFPICFLFPRFFFFFFDPLFVLSLPSSPFPLQLGFAKCDCVFPFFISPSFFRVLTFLFLFDCVAFLPDAFIESGAPFDVFGTTLS